MKKLFTAILTLFLMFSMAITANAATVYNNENVASLDIIPALTSEESFVGEEDTSVLGIQVEWKSLELSIHKSIDFGIKWNPETLEWDKGNSDDPFYSFVGWSQPITIGTVTNRSKCAITVTPEFTWAEGLNPTTVTVTASATSQSLAAASGEYDDTNNTTTDGAVGGSADIKLTKTGTNSGSDVQAIYEAVNSGGKMGTVTLSIAKAG